jgi:N-acetylglucosaminyldiphosphoundecaprenol N-acetyl-beta-D-mannosaminyltransferase
MRSRSSAADPEGAPLLHDWRDGYTPAATRAGRVEVYGCRVDRVTLDEALDQIETWIASGERGRLGLAVNAAKLQTMRVDGGLRALAARADLVVADGVGVVWAAAALGTPLPERVPGVELCGRLLERAASRGWRPYLLGASRDVVHQLRARLEASGVNVAGAHHGYWAVLDEPSVAEAVAASGADLLFVALGSPRQEAFLLRWSAELGVPYAMGVGGSFDVLAGRVERAPDALGRAGLEWAWRMSRQPWRLASRRTMTLAAFTVRLIRTRIQR